MVRESTYGAMGCHIDPSYMLCMVDPLSYFSFQPVLYDWCNILICDILSGIRGRMEGNVF